MRQLSLFVFCVLSSYSVLFASPKDEDVINFYDGEFFLAEEEYTDALLAFKKVYSAGYEDNANLNYRIGICYLNIPGQKAEAIPYLEKASESITDDYTEGSFNEKYAPVDVYLFLGNAYRIDYQLDNAIKSYNRYISEKKKINDDEIQYAQAQIDACNRAKLAINNPAKIETNNLGEKINTGANDYRPVMSANGKVIAYMSEQKFYEAVMYARQENGKFSDPVNITPQVQSDGDQFVTSLSSAGDKLLLAKISHWDSDIMISHFEDGQWSKSENIGRPVNTKFFESHACFSPDGKTIYFTSNRRGSEGLMDIYTSTLNGRGEWSEPKNLGNKINTPLNEESPFISRDGNVLFFSSQGHSTIGGYDIFYSVKDNSGNWSEVKSLPYPINTTDDDLFFFPTGDKENLVLGYLASIKPEGYGQQDIYKLNIIPELTEEKKAEAIKKQEAEKEATEERMKKEAEEKALAQMISYNCTPVFFEFDSYEISDEAEKTLQNFINLLNRFEGYFTLNLQGHADSLGSEYYNKQLSEKRAKAVMKYLTEKGIPEKNLHIVPLGEEFPIAINKNADGSDAPEGRKFNRRVDFDFESDLPGNIQIIKFVVPERWRIK